MTKNEALQEVQALSKGITHDAAQLLDLLGTGAVQLPIDDTDKYVVIGTLAMIAKALPAEQNANALGEFAGYDLDTGEPLVTWYDRAAMPQVGDGLCVCSALPLAAPAPRVDNDQWIFDLAAEHEAPGNGLYGPVTFNATGLIAFVRATQAATAAPVRADVPAELTDEAIDGLWSAMPGGPDGWLKQFGYRQFARSIARHVLVRVAASMAGAIRPTDDELWEQTIGERDCYHEWADKLANAIAAHLGAEIGEHSNMNCPWAEALEVIESASPALRPSEQAVRDQALGDAIEEVARVGAIWIDDSNRAAAASLLNQAIANIQAMRTPSTAQPSKE